MKLIFLGSGSAFTVGADNYHSNMILDAGDGKRLLIDCGSDIRLSLSEQGLTHRNIEDVYISHLHADHAGGLEWLAFNTKFDRELPHKPTLHISAHLVDILWDHTLSGGLQSIESTAATLSTFFDLAVIGDDNLFKWQSIKFHLVKTYHVSNFKNWVPSYGLFFTINQITCFITTDTQFKPDEYMRYYLEADVIFHDCETSSVPSNVHTHYKQLVTLDPSIKEKMWLYHFNPVDLPDAKRDGFRGFVKKGQCFDFSDKKSFI